MRLCSTSSTLVLLAVVSLPFLACSTQPAPEETSTNATRQRAEAFFRIYAERSDFEAFLDFYAEDAVVEDIVNGDLIEGRDAIRAFFDWDSGRVVKTRDVALVLRSLVFEGQHAVATGHFTEFLYDGQPLGPWRFVIALEFDAGGKIRRQEDFINYPDSLLDPERASSNERL